MVYVVAAGNKLTGERGLMGYVEISERERERIRDCWSMAVAMAEFFPRSIASRAKSFQIVTANGRDDLLVRYGREIS